MVLSIKKFFSKNIIMFIAIIVLFILLFNTKTALNGAAYGLYLWIKTVIPTLFPFILISGILLEYRNVPFFPIIAGFLCGYPVGAIVISEMRRKEYISQSKAMFYLSFCNNISPGFIIGYVAYGLSNTYITITDMLFVTYIPPIIIGFISYLYYRRNNDFYDNKYVKESFQNTTVKFGLEKFDTAINNALTSVIKLGGYIIAATSLAAFINNPFITGFIEITSGISILIDSSISIHIIFLLLCMQISFGGISALMQTYGMLIGTDIKLSNYIISKLFTAAIAFVIGAIILYYK